MCHRQKITICGVGFVWLLILSFCGNAFSATENVTPLRNAHAHNDYEHTRPVFDALDFGFCSLEADIHLVNGELLVTHDRKSTKPGKTLEALYFEPLRKRIAENDGRVYRGGPTILLFIDIKSEPEATYASLRKELQKYAEVLTRFEARKIQTNAITVIITGNQPRTTMAREAVRYAACDGRIADLSSDFSAELIPVISDNWTKWFRWNGIGLFPKDEEKILRKFVSEAHRQRRLLRFWQTPETYEFWQELRKAEVDLISADDLSALHKFLNKGKE